MTKEARRDRVAVTVADGRDFDEGLAGCSPEGQGHTMEGWSKWEGSRQMDDAPYRGEPPHQEIMVACGMAGVGEGNH